jgi:hypothetical protein
VEDEEGRQAMKTKKTVLELAKWMYHTCLRKAHPKAKPDWANFGGAQEDYIAIAEELLENPPLVLRRRLRRLEALR